MSDIKERLKILAKNLLGGRDPSPVNFAKVADRIIPEQGQQKDKIFTSWDDISDIEVIPEYEFVEQALREDCPPLFVTGEAGTGKSTLIRYLANKLPNCALVAPTGIAAINIHGATIHAFFGLPPSHVDPEDLEVTNRARQILEKLQYLIVDEVSMVTPNIVDCIDKALRTSKENPSPFGGIPVIFVGDLFQLPPVVSTDEEAVYFSHKYKSRYFFSAEVFEKTDIVPIALPKIKRQTDPEFIRALSIIRVAEDYRESLGFINRNCFSRKIAENDGAIILVPTNAISDAINRQRLNAIEGVQYEFVAQTTGHIQVDKWKVHAPSVLKLKIGAQIIFLKNNKPYWVNGDLGTVVGLSDEEIRVKKKDTDNVFLLPKETWYKYKYVYDYQTRRLQKETVASFTQFPIKLGWAITIHKSQGMTLDDYAIDMGDGAFETGQTYVALSRAKSLQSIHLKRPFSMADVKSDPIIVEFYRSLNLI